MRVLQPESATPLAARLLAEVLADQQVKATAGVFGDRVGRGHHGVLHAAGGTDRFCQFGSCASEFGDNALRQVTVGLEHSQYGGDIDIAFGLVPAVVVRHQSNRRVGDLCFPRQLGLLQVGHADHVDVPTSVETRFGARAEQRTFHAKVGATVVGNRTSRARRLQSQLAQRLPDRIREVGVGHTTVAEERETNVHVHEGIDEATFVKTRETRDATLGMPRLILPSIQVNMRAGELPEPEDNGTRYLKLPINAV